jgi:hypothetical protein
MMIALAIKSVLPFASKDTTRPPLARVHIEVKDRTFRAVATDGVTLAHAQVLIDDQQLEREWDISFASAKMLAGVKGTIAINGTTFVADAYTVAALTDDHVFPRWRSVCQKPDTSPARIVDANPRLLERAAKACRQFVGEDRAVAITISATEHPIFFNASHPDVGDIECLVMPMRL